jgi:hypothetical protein
MGEPTPFPAPQSVLTPVPGIARQLQADEGAEMQRTHSGLALPGTGNQVTDPAWVRWGVAAAVTGMLAWVAGVALIPLDAKLDTGNQHLAQVLRAHVAQGYAAALLAVLGAVLLAAFFAVLTRLVRQGQPGGGLLRVSLAGCVITQTMVAAGASFALADVHAAAGAPMPGWSRSAGAGCG